MSSIRFFFFASLLLVSLHLPVYAHHEVTFGLGGTSGPIITNPASTIPRKHFGVSVRSEYINFDEFSNFELHETARKKEFGHSGSSLHAHALVFGYGLTNDLTFALRFPYNIQSEIRDGLLSMAGIPFIAKRGTSDGLGDLTLFTQYRFLNLKDKAFEAAILSGINIPSGITHVKDRTGARFGPDHLPSKRSFDPLVGLSITKRFTPRFSLDSNYIFTKSIRGVQRYYAGDLHNYNVALSVRLLEPHLHNKHSHNHNHEHPHKHKYGFWEEEEYEHEHEHKHTWYSKFGVDGIVELNGFWRQKQIFERPFHLIDQNSGGSVIYVSPGLRLTLGETWSSFLSIGIPVMQDLSGTQNMIDIRMVYGLTKSF